MGTGDNDFYWPFLDVPEAHPVSDLDLLIDTYVYEHHNPFGAEVQAQEEQALKDQRGETRWHPNRPRPKVSPETIEMAIGALHEVANDPQTHRWERDMYNGAMDELIVFRDYFRRMTDHG